MLAALPMTGILMALSAVWMWSWRDQIAPVHLKILLAFVVASVVFVAQTNDCRWCQLMWTVSLGVSAAMLAFGFFLMKLSGGRDVPSADKSLRMSSGLRDVARSYALPQTVAILVGVRFIDTPIGPLALAVGALFAGLSWVSAQRRLRAIHHTGSSKIVSAAQGQVELSGRVQPLGSKPLASPLRRTPCVWFRYRIEEKKGDKWRLVDSGCSEEPFVLDDGTGTCVVEPVHAQVDTARRESWREGKRRFSEEWIAPGTQLYLLGEFVTENPAAVGRNARLETAALLSQWKKYPAALRKSFDANGDGEVDMVEWEAAQNEAKARVDAEHAQIQQLPATNFLRAPRHQRDFLISDQEEADVKSKAWRGAMLKMIWFGLLLGAAIYTTTRELREHRSAGETPPAVAQMQAN